MQRWKEPYAGEHSSSRILDVGVGVHSTQYSHIVGLSSHFYVYAPSKVAPGRERIYTAGEMEYLKWLDRRDKGVPVGESVQRELAAVRDKLGLSQYVFPFERETSAEMNPDK